MGLTSAGIFLFPSQIEPGIDFILVSIFSYLNTGGLVYFSISISLRDITIVRMTYGCCTASHNPPCGRVLIVHLIFFRVTILLRPADYQRLTSPLPWSLPVRVFLEVANSMFHYKETEAAILAAVSTVHRRKDGLGVQPLV